MASVILTDFTRSKQVYFGWGCVALSLCNINSVQNANNANGVNLNRSKSEFYKSLPKVLCILAELSFFLVIDIFFCIQNLYFQSKSMFRQLCEYSLWDWQLFSFSNYESPGLCWLFGPCTFLIK